MKITIKVKRREVSRKWMENWIYKNTYYTKKGINWIFDEIPETMEKLDFIRFMFNLCEYADYVIDVTLQAGFPEWDYNPVCDYIDNIMTVRYIRNYFNGY